MPLIHPCLPCDYRDNRIGFTSNQGAMHLLLSVLLFCFLPMVLTLEKPLHCVPRKTVSYQRDNALLFREEGVWNYSTMLLREDLGLLVLGARQSIYALDLNNISNKRTSVRWEVTSAQRNDCNTKGKDPEIECKNYIRTLHALSDGRMYVCGTNAFDPKCDYMSFEDGTLILEKRNEDGKGKCPFDPFQKYSSIMVDDNLYSATSLNFLGSEPVVIRSSSVPIRTEFKYSWLNEPHFVSMAQMPESVNSAVGDDDKVYLFFSETAVEYDFNDQLMVSRVARVCKGDLGGQRTLQKKWTSFLKARIACPVLKFQLPYIIQDTYRWCDPQQQWKTCIIYAVFTSQSDTSDLSAVCAYSASDISMLFAEGKYKTPVTVGTSFVKWAMYNGNVPSPRPGACIDNNARKQGIMQTLDLPDQTLQFIRDNPLMDQTVLPIGERPLLVRRGAPFSRIIVNQVKGADGEKYHVMFIGTEHGTLVKAVNYDGDMFIIEEVHIFERPEPINVLRFSNATGQLYAGGNSGAAQIPLATCGRSLSCVDCVLARDPYCGWDKTASKCTALSHAQRDLIQSVKVANASVCPPSEPVKATNMSIQLGGNLQLQCQPSSNLARTSWQRNALDVPRSTHLQFLQDGLLILNASATDNGHYRCLSLERSQTDLYTAVVAAYQVSIAADEQWTRSLFEGQRQSPSVVGLQSAVGILSVLLIALVLWVFYKGYLPLPCRIGNEARGGEENQGAPPSRDAISSEGVHLVAGTDRCNRNNNHSVGAVEVNASPQISQSLLNNESEI